MTEPVAEIEVPFEFRHQCWFCGEPSAVNFSFPAQAQSALGVVHSPLMVPCCNECQTLAKQTSAKSIISVKRQVKQKLIYKYRKDLAIGLNWTKQELAESEFEGGNFAGFKKSAWFMYEVAQGRVNYLSWAIAIDGILQDIPDEDFVFIFDGVEYPSIDDAISHYAENFYLDIDYFKKVLHLLGESKFSQAVRFCRLLVDANTLEKKQAFTELFHQQD